MFDLIVVVSRYYFMFLIIYFLWLGVKYILCERGHLDGDLQAIANAQGMAAVFSSVFAFLILAYNRGFTTLVFGLGVVVFLLTGRFAVKRIYKNGCPLMWNSMFFLLNVGFIMLERLNPALATRQLVFCFAGFIAMLPVPAVMKLIPRFERLELLYLISGISLLGVLFFAGSDAYGAKNWLDLGFISFQPSEFVKILFVFYLASAFGKGPSTKKTVFIFATSALVVAMLAAQRDLGGALIFFAAFMAVMYAATGSAPALILGAASASAASFASYKLFYHVQTRVAAWLNPWADLNNTGYQLTQALFAVCTFGPFGVGLTRGYSAAIPVVERDFIFAAICEEFGSLFGLLLIGVFMLLFYRGIHIALRASKLPHSLLAVGLTAVLAIQTFVILGGGIKLIPMTGVTLPFVSYGGSSVFTCVFSVGILEYLYSRVAKEAYGV